MPVPDEVSAPFWEAAADGRLVLARCSRCETFVHPPEPVCPHCHHTDPRFAFEPAPTTGVVRSWTVIRQSFLPGFNVPFTLLDVALDGLDDLRLIGRLAPEGREPPEHIGEPVHVVFEVPAGGGPAVPSFVLSEP